MNNSSILSRMEVLDKLRMVTVEYFQLKTSFLPHHSLGHIHSSRERPCDRLLPADNARGTNETRNLNQSWNRSLKRPTPLHACVLILTNGLNLCLSERGSYTKRKKYALNIATSMAQCKLNICATAHHNQIPQPLEPGITYLPVTQSTP